MVGGVAGLIAARLGLDPFWLRMAFVVLALAGGVGVVLYAGLWLVLVAGGPPNRRFLRFAGGATIVLGFPLLLEAGPPGFVDGGLAVFVLLVGLAVALWQPRQLPGPGLPPSTDSGSAGSPPSDDTTAAAWSPPPSPGPLHEPSVLGRATLGLAVVVAAVGALIDQANGGRLHPEQWLGAAAAVCGAGMIVGTARGRARWLILPALAFGSAGYIGAVAAELGLAVGSTGDRHVSVGSAGTFGSTRERVTFGDIDINIDGVPEHPVRLDARAGFGDIQVWSVAEATVEVRSAVDSGDVRVNSVDQGDVSVVRIGPDGPPDVIIDARIGRGELSISQYGTVVTAPIDSSGLRTGAETYVTVGPAPPDLASTTPIPISNMVGVTTDGWFVIANGEALIDDNDQIVVGQQIARSDGVTEITTTFGSFQLLPRGLLITPDGEVLDLHAFRVQYGSTAPPSGSVEPSAVTTTVAPAPVITASIDPPGVSTTIAAAVTTTTTPTTTTIAGG